MADIKSQQQSQQLQLEIDMDEQTAQGVYVNLAGVAHNETEFIMDFLFVQPGKPKARLRSRIISSPAHTKRFLLALSDNIRKYEERFGVIVDKAAVPQAHG
ncbi:MAG: DUF3467 domain-containing protein [Elusimicrobiales bacterium]|nr:DUF3467 domain-containing protein [Elusimicrobiales bacterium]